MVSIVECTGCFDYYEECMSGECVHKDLFPMNISEVSSTLMIFIGYMLCAAGGIGGGPVTLPILVLLSNFRVGEAAPLANFLICVGLLFRYILNSRKKHPVIPNRIRVDYTIVQLALPPSLLGTSVGVILNSTLAPIVNLILVVGIFSASAIITLKKGLKLYRQQSQDKKIKRTATENRQSLNNMEPSDKQSQSIQNEEPELPQKAQKFIKAEASHCQWKKMFFPWLHLLLLILFAAIQAPSKGKSNPFSVVELCSAGSWAIRLMFYVVSFLLIALNTWCVKRENKAKHNAQFPFNSQDIQFNKNGTLICFLLFFFIVLTLSSAFGIGGGFIIVLFFYRYHMHPQVASETMVTILFYVLLASSIQFALEARIPWYYALWNTVFALLGTFTGVFAIEKIVKKTGRSSIVVIMVACLVALATILIPIVQIMRFDQIEPYKFKSFC